MKNRLNVTEVERLCYSRRKLRAISALRSVGINPGVYGMHKEYRVLGVKGRVYLVEHPDGRIYHFSRLADMHAYACDYQKWKQQDRWGWAAWMAKNAPAKEHLDTTRAWPDCAYQATSLLDETALCAGHAFIYARMLEERRKRRAS